MKNNDQAILESWKKSNIEIIYPEDVPIHDRIVGSIMGCFVGDGVLINKRLQSSTKFICVINHHNDNKSI